MLNTLKNIYKKIGKNGTNLLAKILSFRQFLIRYIIQTWVESSNEQPNKLLDLGYELIISTKNAWYFDHGFWGSTKYYNWKTAYDNRLPQHKGVLGGEVCVWTELIDENNLGLCNFFSFRKSLI